MTPWIFFLYLLALAGGLLFIGAVALGLWCAYNAILGYEAPEEEPQAAQPGVPVTDGKVIASSDPKRQRR